MSAKEVRIAVAQIRWEDGEFARCADTIESIVHRHGAQSDLIVFPECCASGFSSAAIIEEFTTVAAAALLERIGTLAQRWNVAIVLGMAERCDGRWFNAAFGVGPGGVFMHYRKTHLWVAERELFDAGDTLCIRGCAGLAVAPLICFDIEFAEPVRALAERGAQLIVVPDGNMDPYGDSQLRSAVARAQENHVFVAIANRAGLQGETRFAGRSAIIGPDGEFVARAPVQGESVLTAVIDPGRITASRTVYDYLQERRRDLRLDASG